MNQNLKTIALNAWNEPRHFFLWLALASLCGLGAAAAATGLSNPNRWLSFFALGCSACFLLSLAAFILALIPPFRRLLSWLLARRFLVLACLTTLVALFYAAEDWRGRRSWQSFKERAEEKGERFDLVALTPPPVPADQNYFETPLWNDLHFVRTNDTIVWSDTNWGSHVFFSAFGPNGSKSPSTGNWTKSQRVDLSAWQAYYRSTNNVFPSPNGPPTNYFPTAASPQSPAADVLLALGRFNESRQLLIAASVRPGARFWMNYEAGPGMLLPHLARVKGIAQYLSLHANASLKAGDRSTAVEDLKLLFRLMDSIRNEPILISHLVRMAVLQIGLQPVWEGLADQRWTDPELNALDGELGRLDFLADYQGAVRGERACNLWAVDYIRKMGLSGWGELLGSEHEGAAPGELEKFFGQALFQALPSGWFDQNKLSTCRIHQDYIQPAVDHDRHAISPAWVKQSQSAFEHRGWGIYDAFSKYLVPGYAKSVERFARAQSAVDLARLACALDRYRLAKGQYPDNLAAVVPQFLTKLPPDVIDGGQLQYRRTTDGRFLLYSIGWNETDDGGKVELTKQGSPDPHRGDWVWNDPAS